MRFIFLLGLSGCLGMLPNPTPMTSLRDELPGGGAKCLVVFLPGAGDSAADFERHGFVGALREKGLSVDIVSAQATLGYYVKGGVLERLSADVIGPARAKGYQQTWLMGMSMGGMGTLIYSRAHPDEVNGVLALAPYLGERELIEEIQAAGGLAAWNGAGDGDERALWRWLKGVSSKQERGPTSTSAGARRIACAWVTPCSARCSRRTTSSPCRAVTSGRRGRSCSRRSSPTRTSRAAAGDSRKKWGQAAFPRWARPALEGKAACPHFFSAS